MASAGTAPNLGERKRPPKQRTLMQKWRAVSLNNKLIVVFSGVTMFATVIYTVVAARTLIEIRSGSGDTHTLAQSADIQARKMSDMSSAADKIRQAAEGMVSQEQRIADNANVQAQVSQRAWISVAVQSSIHENGKALIIGQPFDSRFVRTNMGRTPAVNVRSVAERIAVERGMNNMYKPPTFVYREDEFTVDGTFMPQQTTYADIETTLTQIDFDRISSGAVRLYAHGRVQYDDIFGVHHWVNFCAYLLPTGAWANCPYHNDVDQNAN